MQRLSPVEELKIAILLAEDNQSISGELFKEQLFRSWETLKPVNILMSTIKEVATGPNLFRLISGTALGLTTGYLSNKIILGTSSTILRSMLSGILQFVTIRYFSNSARSDDFLSRSIQQNLIKRNIP